MTGSVSTLVLYADYTRRLSYYDDWLDAFKAYPEFSVTAVNICRRGARRALAKRIGDFDLIVLLHSTNADTLVYIDPYRSILKDRRGKLISFVGNEFNSPGTPISHRIDLLRDIGADFIATQLLEEAGVWLYAQCGARVASIPHALNPHAFRATVETEFRPVDLGTRSARYIAYLGDNDRVRLFELFERHEFDPHLVVDISTAERLTRDGWSDFLNRCKGTFANEAGSYFLERDDRTIGEIRSYAMAKQKQRGGYVIANDSPLRRFGHKLPWGVKAALRPILSRGLVRHEMLMNETLDFEEIYDRFFRGRAHPPVYAKAISSRHFDAIGTHTCQILLAGRYNDILQPSQHYLSLEHDFGNVRAVMEEFRDPDRRRQLTQAAYELAIDSHTHHHRVAALHALVG
ncbi:MAG: glycosyltransferase [Proteobacteria bacterium]|nr:glycosyltransferase [Pseudomonadota bacterium]